MKRALYFLAFIFLASLTLHAQDGDPAETGDDRFTIDTPASLTLDEEEEVVKKKKKKKVKKRVFYGVKTRKGFTKNGYGNRVTYELFYYLKKEEKPETFVRDIYWYDFTRREIRKTNKFDPTLGVLLHGPYEKKQGDVVLETGIFYKGTKHGRWMKYNKDSVLLDKEYYYKGWPKESEVTYYDPQNRKNIKEITPIEFGEKEGYYYRFFENGKIAVMGEYQWDQRIGEWVENYSSGGRKRVISYPKEPFSEDVPPFISREWDEKGKEIYRNNTRRP